MEGRQNLFASTLISEVPNPILADAPDVYEWLIGSWSIKAIDYFPDGTKSVLDGEWHFSWALEGRIIQDVLLTPKRPYVHGDLEKQRNRYGTSLRIYKPDKKCWKVIWLNPVSGSHNELTGKKERGQIIQKGKDADGNYMLWVFTDITADSFRWYGERSANGKNNWTLETEFFAERKNQ